MNAAIAAGSLDPAVRLSGARVGFTLEICVGSAAGVAAALSGGADRLELCAALEVGGLTPSAALISRAVETGLPVHVLVRPRSGDFFLSQDDGGLVVADVGVALSRGAAGVVVGALRADGRLDRESLARVRDAVRDGLAVLHRAVDLTLDPIAAVEEACGLGYDKILSSGGATSAMEGAATLARMVRVAGDRLSIIAGAGVRPDNVAALIAATGVREVHSSASAVGAPPAGKLLRFGFASGPPRQTDPVIVARLRAGLIEEDDENDR